MKSLKIISALFVCIFFLAAVSLYAREQNTNEIMEQLNQELEKTKVFTPQELKTIKKPVKNMLNKGAAKDDLKDMLKDLSEKEVKGKDLKNTVDAVNDLVNEGEHPKEAGNIVSQAAHAAQAQGLKGRDLAVKVHEAIRQRKQEREEMKKMMKEMRQERKQMKDQHKEKHKKKDEGMLGGGQGKDRGAGKGKK